MGGRRVAVAERSASLSSGEPLITVRDEGGLWSFEVFGEPDADTVLVLLPAMGVPARYYAPLVDELLDEAVAVVWADFLAERVGRDPSRLKDGFASLVEGCLPAILDTVRQHVPFASPVIVGHSLGGQIGLIAAAQFAPSIPVVLAARGSAWHRAFDGGRRWLYLVGSQTIRGVAAVLGHWPGDLLGFGGRQPEPVIRDWARVVRTGHYTAATGTFDYEAALAGYHGDILAVDVTDDVLAPRTATDALLTKAPGARVTRYAYNGARGSTKPGAHFTWVRDRGGLAPTIVGWARSRSL